MVYSAEDIHTWIILHVFELIHIGVYKNDNDSNCILYRGPDSSPKSPVVAETDLFNPRHNSNYYTCTYTHLEFIKMTLTATLPRSKAQTAAPKAKWPQLAYSVEEVMDNSNLYYTGFMKTTTRYGSIFLVPVYWYM